MSNPTPTLTFNLADFEDFEIPKRSYAIDSRPCVTLAKNGSQLVGSANTAAVALLARHGDKVRYRTNPQSHAVQIIPGDIGSIIPKQAAGIAGLGAAMSKVGLRLGRYLLSEVGGSFFIYQPAGAPELPKPVIVHRSRIRTTLDDICKRFEIPHGEADDDVHLLGEIAELLGVNIGLVAKAFANAPQASNGDARISELEQINDEWTKYVDELVKLCEEAIGVKYDGATSADDFVKASIRTLQDRAMDALNRESEEQARRLAAVMELEEQHEKAELEWQATIEGIMGLAERISGVTRGGGTVEEFLEACLSSCKNADKSAREPVSATIFLAEEYWPWPFVADTAVDAFSKAIFTDRSLEDIAKDFPTCSKELLSFLYTRRELIRSVRSQSAKVRDQKIIDFRNRWTKLSKGIIG
ncbi:MAG: hypothetical protein JST51_01580 [Armatimonadetes bacterium]|nr:hypothetical protein [Armatimonadota bacterium]